MQVSIIVIPTAFVVGMAVGIIICLLLERGKDNEK